MESIPSGNDWDWSNDIPTSDWIVANLKKFKRSRFTTHLKKELHNTHVPSNNKIYESELEFICRTKIPSY